MSRLSKKEKLVCSLIDCFMFREDVEDSYEKSFNMMMEISEGELENYNVNDVCNIIGNHVC